MGRRQGGEMTGEMTGRERGGLRDGTETEEVIWSPNQYRYVFLPS